MLRTGQMLIAQALSTYYLGREWRLGQQNGITMYHRILRWFFDLDSPDNPYSIHHIAKLGRSFDKDIGEWFEPTIIANILKILLSRHSPITCHVPKGGILYLEEIELERKQQIQERNQQKEKQCQKQQQQRPSLQPIEGEKESKQIFASETFDNAENPQNKEFENQNPNNGGSSCSLDENVPNSHHSCIDSGGSDDDTNQISEGPRAFIIPLRLGVSKINPTYIPILKSFFTFPQSIGILGGKPGSSLYFVAVQDDSVFYLDPHWVHEAVAVDPNTLLTSSDLKTHRCKIPRKMFISEMDPSMAIGFLCKNRAEFHDFCERIQQHSHGLLSIEKNSPKAYQKKDVFQVCDDMVLL